MQPQSEIAEVWVTTCVFCYANFSPHLMLWDIKTASVVNFWCGRLKPWSNMDEQSDSSKRRNDVPSFPHFCFTSVCSCSGDGTSPQGAFISNLIFFCFPVFLFYLPFVIASLKLWCCFYVIMTCDFFWTTLKQNQREAAVLWQTEVLKRSLERKQQRLSAIWI